MARGAPEIARGFEDAADLLSAQRADDPRCGSPNHSYDNSGSDDIGAIPYLQNQLGAQIDEKSET